MAPAEAGEEEATRVRAQNEQLRAENQRLRAAVCAARPATPEPFNVPPPTPSGGALGAADRLVHLMREGGHLLKEREALMLENEALESELEAVVGSDGQEAAAAAEGPDEAQAQADPEVAEAQGDLAVVDTLMPLLSEGDALRTEREGLRVERKELLTELEALGAEADAGQAAELEAGDEELEGRFLSAVEEASRENSSLEAEIRLLREENARLRSKEASAAAKPARHKAQAKPKAVVDEFEVSFQQREAMAALLRKSQERASPTGRRDSPAKELADTRRKADLDSNQEEQMKGALYTLFRGFGK